MKSITINNLVFTDELPTKPGWYLRSIDDSGCYPCHLVEREGCLYIWLYADWFPIINLKGYWHRLVPAAWLEDAYKEGVLDTSDGDTGTFGISVARQRMEGTNE
jgi:hypothetical protein